MFKIPLSLPVLLLIPTNVLFGTLLAKPVRAATTYYIATNGSDSNPGTQAKPFATLTHAATKTKPGDTVYVRGGTYYITRGQYIASVGTASAHITYQSYPGETAIIDGSKVTTGSLDLVDVTGQYNDFKNFELRNAKRYGLLSFRGKHIQLIKNVIHNSQQNGINVSSDSGLTSASDIRIDGNTVYDNGLGSTATTWPQGIASYKASNITIVNNRVYQNYGEGIDFVLTNGGLAANNIVYDNFNANMYLDNASNVTMEKNLIYTTNNKKFYRDGQPATGIQAANEPYDMSNPLNKVTIRNNIVIGGKTGFLYGTYGNGGGLKNFVIANNTFYKAPLTMLFLPKDAGHQNNLIANNIFHQTGGGTMIMDFTANSAFKFQNNLWYGGNAGPAAGIGDVKADPQFVKPGSLVATDYKLKTGSPAIDAGTKLTQVTDDFAKVTRPQGKAYDIGAYER
ncbi:MAG TPA: right-handed parallel beta-helix repeat-containing protein [Coleofasciculaceae cyanobacterium]